MARLMRGRTTLLISHRQKVFVNCDLMLTVGKARPIVEASDSLAIGRFARRLDERHVFAREG